MEQQPGDNGDHHELAAGNGEVADPTVAGCLDQCVADAYADREAQERPEARDDGGFGPDRGAQLPTGHADGPEQAAGPEANGQYPPGGGHAKCPCTGYEGERGQPFTPHYLAVHDKHGRGLDPGRSMKYVPDSELTAAQKVTVASLGETLTLSLYDADAAKERAGTTMNPTITEARATAKWAQGGSGRRRRCIA